MKKHLHRFCYRWWQFYRRVCLVIQTRIEFLVNRKKGKNRYMEWNLLQHSERYMSPNCPVWIPTEHD